MGEVNNSILFSEVTIGKGTVVNNSVVHPGCIIEDGAEVNNAVVTEGVIIKQGEKIGKRDDDKIYLVSEEGIMSE